MADEADDDIGADLRAALAGELSPAPAVDTPIEAEAPAPESEAPAETAQQKADRERDQQGRFAKPGEGKPRETLTLKPEAAKPLTDAAKAAPALAPEIDKAGKHLERIPPPQAWKGAAKVDWDRMPRNVREAIAADYAGVEQARAELAPLKELFDTNREFLVNQAGSVVEAQRQMMQFARMSVDNPVQLAEHILRARGIDPRAAFSGQPQASTQGQQPDFQATLAQLVDQKLQPILGGFQQQQTQQLQSQINSFASDPAHPYFNDLRVQMGKLMETGFASTLEEAYVKAALLDPAIRAAHEATQAEEADRKKAAEVERARNAQRASITGSPVPGAASLNGSGNPNASIREDLLAAVRQHTGAV